MRVTLSRPLSGLYIFLPLPLDSCARASSHFRKEAGSYRAQPSRNRRPAQATHESGTALGTRECSTRVNIAYVDQACAGLLPIVALIVTFNEHGSRVVLSQGSSLFIQPDRGGNFNPDTRRNEEISDKGECE